MGGSSPSPAPAPAPPAVNDPVVEAALLKEKTLNKKRRGRSKTLLEESYGGQGDPALKDNLGE
jgi:hypothetical protein